MELGGWSWEGGSGNQKRYESEALATGASWQSLRAELKAEDQAQGRNCLLNQLIKWKKMECHWESELLAWVAWNYLEFTNPKPMTIQTQGPPSLLKQLSWQGRTCEAEGFSEIPCIQCSLKSRWRKVWASLLNPSPELDLSTSFTSGDFAERPVCRDWLLLISFYLCKVIHAYSFEKSNILKGLWIQIADP